MADIAGLIVGVASLWQSCVQVYEIVESTRQYGVEYELLNVKFEVERIRLLCWGDVVGLVAVQRQGPSATADSSLDVRLHREDVRTTVLRLLGCIQYLFEDTDRLQDRYGLQATPAPESLAPAGSEQHHQGMSQSQRILNGVFKRAYDTLRRMARERQRNTPLARRTVWAVRDRKKFEVLVAELRGFNDSLESLFPDAQRTAAEAMRSEVDDAVQVRELQLLQEATAVEHRELSERTSLRLVELGATVSARTGLLSETQGDDADMQAAVGKLALQDTGTDGTTPEIEDKRGRVKAVELYMQKKSLGALNAKLMGPYFGSACVSSEVSWDGEKGSRPYWDDRHGTFVSASHASFGLYKRKKYMRQPSQGERLSNWEECVLLDPESLPEFENVNPGTVTVEGYAIECWSYEQTKPAASDNNIIFVNYANLPELPARTLLRRVNELQQDRGKFGWQREKEELDLREIVGTLGYKESSARDPKRWISDLYEVLSRRDIFADFSTTSSVGLTWGGEINDTCIGLWNFLRQIIVGRELALRLEHLKNVGSIARLTERILANLIVSDLWLHHVKIVLIEVKYPVDRIKGPEREGDKLKAQDLNNKGDEALSKNEYQQALDLYTDAVKINLPSVVYRCNRSASLLNLERYQAAEEDAHVGTQLDPQYAKAWSLLGKARLNQGHGKRAKEAYERGLEVARGNEATQMRQDLANAEDVITKACQAISSETDTEKQHKLRSTFFDEDWETIGKTFQFRSLVHEQQVEALLLFAERMRWPYINELRDYAEDVYSNMVNGGSINFNLHDWLYGMILPGKWYAFKIMTTMILCTPSIADKVGVAPYLECGLWMPTRSYWRLRTVLGRVLGCLPGVISLCGWVGPCPPVEIDPPPVQGEKRPRHIRLKARRVALTEHKLNSDGEVISTSNSNREEATRIRPDEEIEPYLAEMLDHSAWVIPEPPIRDISTCEIESIQLKKLAPDVDVTQKSAAGATEDDESETEYRASITFKIDNNEKPITYKLFTNPVFVTPPPCSPGPRGLHEVHMRELPRYQNNIWSIERLKEHTAEDEGNDEVMVINATGKGAEVLARAWCAERGTCAVIRRAGGPCFVCAVRAAGKGSLGTGVLIWTE